MESVVDHWEISKFAVASRLARMTLPKDTRSQVRELPHSACTNTVATVSKANDARSIMTIDFLCVCLFVCVTRMDSDYMESQSVEADYSINEGEETKFESIESLVVTRQS